MERDVQVSQLISQLTASESPFALQKDSRGLLSYQNALKTLPEVIESARREDQACFMVYQEERWSFERFFDELDRLACWMLEQQVKQGSVVAIACRNRPEWAVAFCAAARIGAIPAPLNSFGRKDELRAALEDIQPALLVCDKDRFARLEGKISVEHCPILVVDDSQKECESQEIESVVHFREVIETINKPQAPLPMPELNDDSSALILFTSGTTSRAKAVLSSQQAVCQSLFNIDFISAMSGMSSPGKVQKIIADAKTPVILSAVPLFHVSGLHAQFLTALRNGTRLVFMHKWDVHTAYDLMKKEQVTQFNGAPSMLLQLFRDNHPNKDEILAQLVGLGFGGAGVPESLMDHVFNIMPEQMIGIGFGMTESNGVASAISGDLFRANRSSSGVISPIMQVKIVDYLGQEMAEGEVGEVWLKGVTVMTEYFANPQGTAEVMHDGWLSTGDLGLRNKDGFLFIVGRLKELINRNGENVSPQEVESCLQRHSAVKEAAVFGIDDDDTGEAIVAVVSLDHHCYADEQELRSFVNEHLASYKVPSQIHILERNLPRSPAGKLLRKEIKREFSAKAEA
ncbi:long-chain fatty acid--CoA ligase [Vibrio sinensis]|uniref:Long-chain fatty acid--CoA ligase n=1 Tax=Vibrio sinensis TaxID=2302434 RepID=A0A3A6QAQ5_9VIBR|nr:class I adenylate-forming enzyme family protein [Vibrio sinensis]RJX68902.1 long-chain fatty acid--CoA ligase [Vibrio sinensis]